MSASAMMEHVSKMMKDQTLVKNGSKEDDRGGESDDNPLAQWQDITQQVALVMNEKVRCTCDC
jgi:hypothetical protein